MIYVYSTGRNDGLEIAVGVIEPPEPAYTLALFRTVADARTFLAAINAEATFLPSTANSP